MRKEYGRSFSKVQIILIIGGLMAPFVGGLIILLFGFDALFTASLILLLGSGIPLLMTKDHHFKLDYKPSKFYNFVFHKLSANFFWAHVGKVSPEAALWFLWPIFIYIIVQNPAKLGIIISVASIIAILVSQFLGKYVDKHKSSKILKNATKTSAAVFFIRTLIPNPILLVVTDAINKVIDPLINIPYYKNLYEYIKKTKKPIEVSISTAFILSFTWLVLFGFLIIMFGLLEMFGIDIALWMFIILFILFGLPVLLVPRIEKAVNNL